MSFDNFERGDFASLIYAKACKVISEKIDKFVENFLEIFYKVIFVWDNANKAPLAKGKEHAKRAKDMQLKGEKYLAVSTGVSFSPSYFSLINLYHRQ